MTEQKTRASRETLADTIPGPRGLPFLGVLPGLRRDPLGTLIRAARDYGDVVALPAGPRRVYLVNHPDHIHRVLQDNHRNYGLPGHYRMLRPVFGKALFTSEGESWRRQRDVLQPSFRLSALRELAPVVATEAERLLARFEQASAGGAPVDVAEVTPEFTLNVASRALFGAELGDRAPGLARDVRLLMEEATRRAMALVPFAADLPSARNRRFARALARLDTAVAGIVVARRQASSPAHSADLLARLMAAADAERDADAAARELHDQVKMMLVSATATTANALTWTWYLLSRHPHAETRLRREVADVLGGGVPGAADLERLTYVRMAVQEALRLYPPTWRVARTALGPDTFGRYRIPAGAIIVFSPYLVHRHKDAWKSPDAFDPERFSAERSRGRPQFSYIPFGGGPRACIGAQLATMEAQIAVAMAAQRFRMRPVVNFAVEIEAITTMRPRAGLWMRLERTSA
jgi:cytochrome P450